MCLIHRASKEISYGICYYKSRLKFCKSVSKNWSQFQSSINGTLLVAHRILKKNTHRMQTSTLNITDQKKRQPSIQFMCVIHQVSIIRPISRLRVTKGLANQCLKLIKVSKLFNECHSFNKALHRQKKHAQEGNLNCKRKREPGI